MSIDPRNVGAFEGDLEATAAALQHVTVDFGAIAKGGTAIHDIAHKEIAEREAKAAALKAKLDAGERVEAEVSAWGLNVPVTLRDKERYSDHDRANYLGAVVAIDYRHWVPGVSHDEGSPSPAKSHVADENAALPPFQPVAPLQFWHIYPSADGAQEGEHAAAAAAALDCNRGSMAMTTSLRHAVDGLLVMGLGTSAEPVDRVAPWHWYRPEELADESKWNACSAGSIMTYRLQPAGAPRPTSQELLQTAAATWAPVVIPDVGQRAAIVRDIARSLLSATAEGSSFYDLAVRSKRRLYSADGDGTGFIERLVRLHPRYDDRGTLGGSGGGATKDVFLLKLAQLTAIAFVEARGLFKDPTPFDFIDAETALHVAPDYQLPKPLRACGLLRYSERLAALVDGCCLLPMGSAEEVELRVATMVAARALQRHLAQATGAPVSIALVDYVLWYAGRMSSASQHHLTITHFY